MVRLDSQPEDYKLANFAEMNKAQVQNALGKINQDAFFGDRTKSKSRSGNMTGKPHVRYLSYRQSELVGKKPSSSRPDMNTISRANNISYEHGYRIENSVELSSKQSPHKGQEGDEKSP